MYKAAGGQSLNVTLPKCSHLLSQSPTSHLECLTGMGVIVWSVGKPKETQQSCVSALLEFTF